MKKQPASSQNDRFPVFCKRLEEELFRNAQSKVSSIKPPAARLPARSRLTRRALQEEYLDISTLEQRLQLVARSMATSKANASAAAASAGVAANGAVQAGLLQQAQLSSLQAFSQVPTGVLGAAQLAAAPGAALLGMVPNAAVGAVADGAVAAALQQNPSPAANGLVPTDPAAQSLLQAQLQQQAAIQASQAAGAGAAAAATQQMMSNGVPVIRGSRAQGQQQVRSAPRAACSIAHRLHLMSARCSAGRPDAWQRAAGER